MTNEAEPDDVADMVDEDRLLVRYRLDRAIVHAEKAATAARSAYRIHPALAANMDAVATQAEYALVALRKAIDELTPTFDRS